VARLYWEHVWPVLQQKLSRPDKAVVLGTTPCLMPDGAVKNRSPILCGGKPLHQDKLCLTPWENQFQGGDSITLWQFKGATFAVLVCLDIEMPEFATKLRGRGVDAILVPSATESVMGLERISRCAAARSVELCCHVGVAHLTGTADSELVDKNVGRAAWFSPSQAAFDGMGRDLVTATVWSGCKTQCGMLNLRSLARCRSARAETNPALIPAGFDQKILVESVRIS
jgi:predicted amidohydrolase